MNEYLIDDEMWFDSWTPENKLRFISFPSTEITEVDIENPVPIIIGTVTATPSP
jgi:hypothetical protein